MSEGRTECLSVTLPLKAERRRLTFLETATLQKSCVNQRSTAGLRGYPVTMVNRNWSETLCFQKTVGNLDDTPTSNTLLQLNEVIMVEGTGRDVGGGTIIFMFAAHSAHPLETIFQRPSVPLKRVTVSGPISTRQNDCGGACIA